MNLEQIIKKRYTVKKFDANKKIDNEKMEELKDLLRLAPSSTNIQPWHFTIVKTEQGKEKVLKSTVNYGFNNHKIAEASHIVVFSVKYKQMDEHLNLILNKEDQDGRFPLEQYKEDQDTGRKYFYNTHKDLLHDDKDWLEKQVYLNIGHFVLGAKSLGIDSVIMEGFDSQILTQELDLDKQGLKASVIVGIGYGADDDFNKNLPKSRLSIKDVITEI